MTEQNPAFKVVAGNPTAEELAVVVAVLQAASATANQEAAGKLRKLTSTWHRNRAVLRSPITPGPGQWRGSVRSGLN